MGGSVEIAGNSLVIPEQEEYAPIPIIEIDGVKYYHKHEFDLVQIHEDYADTVLDLITGEDDPTWNIYDIKSTLTISDTREINLDTCSLEQQEQYFILAFPESGDESDINFTSRAFTVVDSLDEVTDNTKNLPT